MSLRKTLLTISFALSYIIANAQCGGDCTRCDPTLTAGFPLIVGNGEVVCFTTTPSSFPLSITVDPGGVLRLYDGVTLNTMWAGLVSGSVSNNGRIEMGTCAKMATASFSQASDNRNVWIGPSTADCGGCAATITATGSDGPRDINFAENCCMDLIPSPAHDLTENCTLLPVEISSMECIAKKEGIIINWSTHSEKNNSHFIVEKSNDLNNWVRVDSTVSKAYNGFSSTELNYSIEDKTVAERALYYRIVQFDMDGTSSISSVRYIETQEMEWDAQLYLASQKSLTITLYDKHSEIAIVKIHDLKGNLLFEKKYNYEQNSINEELDLSQLGSGYYVVSASSASFHETIKIIRP